MNRQYCAVHFPSAARPKRRTQAGSALLVSIVMLLLMSLMGISAMQGTLFQERMAGNMRDRELSFEAAEAALRQGERLLLPVAPANAFTWPLLANAATWNGAGARGTLGGLDAQLAGNPVFHVGWQGEICPIGGDLGEPCTDVYTVTSRAVGGSDVAITILQSRF